MKVYDRLWLLLNRKVRGKTLAYLDIVLPWCTMGFVLGLVLLAFAINPSWISALLLILVPLFSVGGYLYDRKTGYVDSIYRHNLERRKEKLKQLGNK